MSVERGKDWGDTGPLPAHGVVVSDDAAASKLIAKTTGQLPPVGLIGGDLRRTLGGRRTRGQLRSADAARVTVDYGVITFDDVEEPFVAHVVARNGWLRGPVIAVMNAAFHRTWNVAPKAHPGDGRLDIFEVTLSTGDRLKARRRLPSGTHIPHPNIATRSVSEAVVEFDRPLDIWIDGRKRGRSTQIEVRVVPDALDVVV